MEPFRWRRALFLGLVSYAASLAGLVFDTFVPVLLQAGHPLCALDHITVDTYGKKFFPTPPVVWFSLRHASPEKVLTPGG